LSKEGLTPTESEQRLIDKNLSRDEIQRYIDYYIPEDLQKYFISSQYNDGQREADEFFTSLQKENPNSTIDDRVRIFNNTERGRGIGTNILRDTWGIYTFNTSLHEVNFIKEQLQST
jgi:hypothetical protein